MRSSWRGVALNPSDRILIRHTRGETRMQRKSHMETEAETGGKRPPAQGRTPGACRSWKRWGGPSPAASAGSSALGPLDLRHLVPRAGAGWMCVVAKPPHCRSPRKLIQLPERAAE